MKHAITSKETYHETMVAVYDLMNRGENKMTQAKLADKLGLGKSKLSEILSGKRKPDVPFLKAVYKKLKVDPAFLLDHA